ncbi:UNVERIFIED_CONTAM: hypothetical protein FKN15_056836 [Acipenser sinensis]
MSVIKAGFLVTARGGSGIVVARLPDGRWSAPSAIGIAGLGGGFEIGVEDSDSFFRAFNCYASRMTNHLHCELQSLWRI